MKNLIQMNARCASSEQSSLLIRLTLHLNARLLDFGPGGPEVLTCEPDLGFVAARFPGHETAQIIAGLEQRGFLVALKDDQACFFLSPSIRFEDLDRLWGCLFELL